MWHEIQRDLTRQIHDADGIFTPGTLGQITLITQEPNSQHLFQLKQAFR